METCPHCGADVPPDAKACPECGSDEETGWSEQARYDQLDLPDENFDYDDFVKRELSGQPAKPRGMSPVWWVCAIVLLALIIFMFIRSSFPR